VVDLCTEGRTISRVLKRLCRVPWPLGDLAAGAVQVIAIEHPAGFPFFQRHQINSTKRLAATWLSRVAMLFGAPLCLRIQNDGRRMLPLLLTELPGSLQCQQFYAFQIREVSTGKHGHTVETSVAT
jgi:hypothetical protein